jgi:hypothetical protein
VWYAPRGPGFVVIQPPIGLVINVLPPYYSTVWFGGNPYYYADNVYYTWRRTKTATRWSTRRITRMQPTAAPDSPPVAERFDYLSQERSDEGSAGGGSIRMLQLGEGPDGLRSHSAGRRNVQSGDADHARNNYNRAMSACLQGRGYQVKFGVIHS